MLASALIGVASGLSELFGVASEYTGTGGALSCLVPTPGSTSVRGVGERGVGEMEEEDFPQLLLVLTGVCYN